jgi:hypothetical protein
VRQPVLTPRGVRLLIEIALTVFTIPTLARADVAGSSEGSSPTRATIVLVHGAWADGSSWSQLIPILQREGYTVLAPPIHCGGLPETRCTWQAI